MRALLLIVAASLATQLPARSSHDPVNASERRGDQACSSKGDDRPIAVDDGRTFRPLIYSQSII